MATVTDRITNIIRPNIDDAVKSRFTTDEALLPFFKQAIRRAQGYGFRKRYGFMKQTITADISAQAEKYMLPTDFLVQSGVWRTDTREAITLASEEEFETDDINDEFSQYIIEADGTANYIYFLALSDSIVPIKIRYYADVLPDSLLVTTQMPWAGKLDYPICQYVTMRANNVDRYDLTMDQQLLADMETAISDMFVNIDQTIGEPQGAF